MAARKLWLKIRNRWVYKGHQSYPPNRGRRQQVADKPGYDRGLGTGFPSDPSGTP